MKKIKRGSSTWDRFEAAVLLNDFHHTDQSQRAFAITANVPRTTLQHWNTRAKKIELPPATVAFFESPDGQQFLHCFQVALLTDLHERGNASLGILSTFLRRLKLDRFMAASETSLQRAAAELERKIITFGQEERARLATAMPQKKISVAEDETFPSGTCLVAIEPISNFILLEQLTKDRKTATWNQHMQDALSGLPVEVIQCVSDEGKSLLKHAAEGLGAHHSPDLFHIQHDLTKAASAQLQLRVKRAEESLRKQQEKVAAEVRRKDRFEELAVKTRGRPPAFDSHIERQRTAEMADVQLLRKSIAERKQFYDARRDLSKIYHPYALETGLPQSPEIVREKLVRTFDRIQVVTDSLAETFRKKVTKARKQISAMTATMTFYFTMVSLYLDNLQLDFRTRGLLEDFLIPSCYLKRVANTVTDKSSRYEILHTSEHLMSDFNAQAGPFASYSQEDLQELQKIAQECAEFYHRSSSCVEGRNGQLSLKHHNLHSLKERKLSALTVIHNFDTRRVDRTTPAQRFFRAQHRDLFEFILKETKPPGRPRIQRRLAVAA
jgi:hypothetical protein